MLGAATGHSLGLAGGVCFCAAAGWCSREIVNVTFCVWCCGDNKVLVVAFWFALLLGNNKINAMDKFWWWRLSARYRHKATRICYGIFSRCCGGCMIRKVLVVTFFAGAAVALDKFAWMRKVCNSWWCTGLSRAPENILGVPVRPR